MASSTMGAIFGEERHTMTLAEWSRFHAIF
jgi:hypothetical protein